IWLCLDDVPAATPAERLRDQQEVEQLVEDYLAARPAEEPHRPMALLLTKSDRHDAGDDAAERARERFGMALHALATHCPGYGLFAVSSLGGSTPSDDGVFTPKPAGLAEPLTWLVDALRLQDEARIDALWNRSGNVLPLLNRSVACF